MCTCIYQSFLEVDSNWSHTSTVLGDMENCTVGAEGGCVVEESLIGLKTASFVIYTSFLIALLIVTFGFVLLVLTALVSETNLATSYYSLLINLLMANLFQLVFLLINGLSAVTLGASSLTPPPILMCRIVIWGTGMFYVASTLSLAAFSVLIYMRITLAKLNHRWTHIAAAIAMIYIASFVLLIPFLVPYSTGMEYKEGVACYFDRTDMIIPALNYSYTVCWSLFSGIVPLAVSIILPLITLYYIKKQSISESVGYKKVLARLTLFLSIDIIVSIIGQIVAPAVAYFEGPDVHISYGMVALTAPLNPILIVIFLKPVRCRVKEMLITTLACECKRRQKTDVTPDQNAAPV